MRSIVKFLVLREIPELNRHDPDRWNIRANNNKLSGLVYHLVPYRPLYISSAEKEWLYLIASLRIDFTLLGELDEYLRVDEGIGDLMEIPPLRRILPICYQDQRTFPCRIFPSFPTGY